MKKQRLTFLVLSDSHGDIFNLQTAIKRAGRIDAVIFLGDGLADFSEVCLPEVCSFFAVRGNCDYFTTDPLTKDCAKTGEITVFDKKIVFTHGDLYGVKYSMDGLYSMAKSRGASVVLFGHTHRPHEEYTDGVCYFNPGSLSTTPSAGVLVIGEDGVCFSFMEL